MELPSVYANKIDKSINNNDDIYRSDNSTKVVFRDARELIRFFDRSGYADRLSVKLFYSDNTDSVERLILFRDDYFVNIDNKKIYLKNIINFELQ